MIRSKHFKKVGNTMLRATIVKCYVCDHERLVPTKRVKKLKTNFCLDCWRTKINPFKIRKYIGEMGRDESGKFVSNR